MNNKVFLVYPSFSVRRVLLRWLNFVTYRLFWNTNTYLQINWVISLGFIFIKIGK